MISRRRNVKERDEKKGQNNDGGRDSGQWCTKAVGVNSRGESGSLQPVAAYSVLGQITTWAKTNMECLLPNRK